LCECNYFIIFFINCFVLLLNLHFFTTRRSSDLFTEATLKGMIYAEYELTKAQVMQAQPDCAPLERQYDRGPRQLSAVDAFQFQQDRKSTRLNFSHVKISYAVFCLKKKRTKKNEF